MLIGFFSKIKIYREPLNFNNFSVDGYNSTCYIHFFSFLIIKSNIYIYISKITERPEKSLALIVIINYRTETRSKEKQGESIQGGGGAHLHVCVTYPRVTRTVFVE